MDKVQHFQRQYIALAVALALLLGASEVAAVTSGLKIEFSGSTNYESNIYHAPDDSLETSALLTVLDLRLDWRTRSSSRLRHRVVARGNLDAYPDYSNRNKRSVGIAYRPGWHYSREGKLEFDIELARRNKDLVDDAGEVQSRTLEKWQLDASIEHHYEIGSFDTELRFYYGSDNYDETETLTSYDYRSVGSRARITYAVARPWDVRLTLDLENRDYDERQTYTVRFGAYFGRPSVTREYTFRSIEVESRYDFSRHLDVRVAAEFAQREENFENFYGYDVDQYRAQVHWSPLSKHRTTVSYRFKEKRYENYWNSRVGRNHRVWIDYSDFKFAHEYRFSRRLLIHGTVRVYEKESNDPNVAYRNVTAGLGFALTY